MLSNVANTDLFYTAITRLNQTISILNNLTDYNIATVGTITLNNPLKFNGGVTLNVANGMISGDAGLISNVRGSAVSSIPNSSLVNVKITLATTNPNQVSISTATANLGGNALSFSILTSNSLSDSSQTNIASPYLTYTLNLALNATAANLANLSASTLNVVGPAFNQANTALANAANALALAVTANTLANSAYYKAAAAFQPTGGTISGSLVVSNTAPSIILNKPSAGQNSLIYGCTANVIRWVVNYADSTAELGGDTGSHFSIGRFSDAGTLIDSPLVINRTTGVVSVSQGLTGLISTDITNPLGFTPVQQGTGVGQAGNLVKLGWNGTNALLATVDISQLGPIFTEAYITGGSNYNNYGFYHLGTTYASTTLGSTYSGGSIYVDGLVLGYGTWRAMGFVHTTDGSIPTDYYTTLFLRIG